jgi:hypothetical protein
MSIRGERFTIDFSDDEDDASARPRQPRSNPVPGASALSFVKDIVEREPTAPKPPSAPIFKQTTSGFPEHKKRTKPSAFKQRSQAAGPSPAGASPSTAIPKDEAIQSPYTTKDTTFQKTEQQLIDEENKQRLAAMSEDEIEQERRELFSSLDPSLIEKLLKKANMDDGRGDTGFDIPAPSLKKDSQNEKSVRFGENIKAEPESRNDEEAIPITRPAGKPFSAAQSVTMLDEDEEPADPGELHPVSEFKLNRDHKHEHHDHGPHAPQEPLVLESPAVHFPNAPTAPELDPSDPNFLENLHTKYFPSLPADPSKLAWMAPIPSTNSPADLDSPYHPSQAGLPASALRFDFRGNLLPPRIARAMPTNRGLHHHGEAPEAAGYTIPELARLARSAFPAQRCVAFQTLGRILYRLGRGTYGGEGSETEMGLWRCVEEGRVVETLEEAASAERGHQGSRVYATEAVWLWQKGGGKRWKAN